jgi:hypothetical protein
MRSMKLGMSMLVVLTTVASVLVGPVTSASAGELSGTVKGGPFILEGGGATLTCTGSEGTYQVVKPTEKEPKWEKQEKSNPGKDLLINIAKWTGCKAKSSLIKEATPIVSPCLIHLQDEAPEEEKTTKSKANISIFGCKVEVKVVGTCTLTIPNQSELHEALLENMTNDLLITANLSGITIKPSSACLGIKETKEGKLKEVMTAEGVIHL